MLRKPWGPANVFEQRSDTNKVVFKAHFSNHSSLNKPGEGEVEKEGSNLATEPIQVKRNKNVLRI